jgi:hypothetical protein
LVASASPRSIRRATNSQAAPCGDTATSTKIEQILADIPAAEPCGDGEAFAYFARATD